MYKDKYLRPSDDNYGVGFPLLVIGSAIVAMTVYLAVGTALLSKPEPFAKVYIQVADTAVDTVFTKKH